MIRKILTPALCGIAFAGHALAAPVNETCPVEGKEVAGKKTSSLSISFCSKKCKDMFDKAPANYMAVLAETKDGTCPMSHKKSDPSVSSTLVIGTCCGDCKEKFDAAPKKFLTKIK